MIDLLRLFPARTIRRQPVRSMLAVVGAACGVALFVAIEIINASTLRYFAEGVRAVAGGSDLVVVGAASGFPSALRDRVLGIAGVRAAVPSVEVVAHVALQDEWEPDMLGVLGVDPALEPVARSYRMEHATAGLQAMEAIADDGAIVLPADYADGHAGKTGSFVRLIGQAGIERLRVAGRVSPMGAAPSGYALVKLGTAQRLFGFDGRITRLDVIVERGHDTDTVAERLREALGPAYSIEGSRARELDMQRMVRGYQALLRFMSLATLLAGAMAVAATMNISVREQSATIGILRALGAERARLVALFAFEAALLSAGAAVLGVIAGWYGAQRLVGAVTHTLANTYMIPMQPGTLVYPLGHALAHGIFAWLIGVAAALTSVMHAARIQPAEAVRSSGIETSVRFPRWLRALGIVGTALAVYLAVALLGGLDRDAPDWQWVNAALGVGAALALTPVFAVTGLRWLPHSRAGRAVLDRHALLRLAAANVLRVPGRSAWRVLLFSVGLLAFVAIDTLHRSLLASVENWIERVVHSDILVASPGRLFLMEVQPLNESTAASIDAVPGVRVEDGRGAMAIRYATIRYQGRDITVKAFDRPHPWLRKLPFDFRSGERLERGGDIFSGPAALVSENFARHFGKKSGDELTLESPAGPVRLAILGIVTDFASPTGVVYLPRELYRDRWGDSLVSVFSVMVAPGASPARVAGEIDARLGSQGVHATVNRELRRQARDIIAESFAYTKAIEGAALVAAILGVMNSMTAAVFASRRELALLRAVGMDRSGVARMVVWEGLLLGVPASIAAAILGLLLSYQCLVDLGSVIMGWTLEFHASPATIAAALVLGTLSGAAASALAAWRGSHVPVIEGLVAY